MCNSKDNRILYVKCGIREAKWMDWCSFCLTDEMSQNTARAIISKKHHEELAKIYADKIELVKIRKVAIIIVMIDILAMIVVSYLFFNGSDGFLTTIYMIMVFVGIFIINVPVVKKANKLIKTFS